MSSLGVPISAGGPEVEARLRAANRALRLLSRCNTAVVRATDEHVLLHELCRIAVEVAGYYVAWVGRAEHDPEKTVKLVVYAGPGELLREVRVTWGDDFFGQGVLGRAIRCRQVAIVSDIANDASFTAWRKTAGEHNIASAIGVPLLTGPEVYGALGVYALERDAFDSAEIELLEELGANISHGLTALRTKSERVQADRAIAVLVERLRRAQAVAEVGCWELDLTTNTMWGSEEASRIYGLPVTEDQRLPVADVQRLPLSQYRLVLDQALSDLIAGARPYDLEIMIRRPSDGEVRHVHTRAELARGPNGDPAKVLGTIQDVTGRKQLEHQLLQAQKMESVGRLAGGIAHDFNNLLTVIQGYAAMALDQVGQDARLHRDLNEIEKAAHRAGELTQQLLAFSRKQVLQPQVLDLNEIVAGADRMLRRIIGEDIQLELNATPALGRVLADRGQIEQVIVNLAVNARDAMPEGGKLTIETDNAELGPDYAMSHPEVKPGKYVVLAMTDTGVGMDAATLGRIFEPFFTTKQERGTGLGLSTVYGIVRQSGGHIWVYSEPRRGTTFKIHLPRAPEGAPVSDRRSSLRPSRPKDGSETILVVEDNDQVRAFLLSVLSRAGYAVACASNAVEALRLADQTAGPIHVLLTDVVMPGLSGPDLAARLLASRPATKVVYMSGYTDNAIVHQGILERGIHFLAKPIDPNRLLSMVREVLEAEASVRHP